MADESHGLLNSGETRCTHLTATSNEAACFFEPQPKWFASIGACCMACTIAIAAADSGTELVLRLRKTCSN
jgi:hypothetical protein